MEQLIVLLLVAVIWLIVRGNKTASKVQELENQLQGLRKDIAAGPSVPRSGLPTPQPDPSPASLVVPIPTSSSPVRAPVPPPLPWEVVTHGSGPAASKPLAPVAADQCSTIPTPTRPEILPLSPPAAPNWERFFGVNLFAWVGGLALFLGIAFFVKYSFERGWISPVLRVLAGLITGLGSIVLAHLLPRQRQAVTVQALCASGYRGLRGDRSRPPCLAPLHVAVFE